MVTEPVGLRLQRLPLRAQVLILAGLAQSRGSTGSVSPSDVTDLFEELALPTPARTANDFAALAKAGYLAKGRERGQYRLTPSGRAASEAAISALDVVALEAESARYGGTQLGRALHATVPPALAPPALIEPLRKFLVVHPFETNVFGMTRFPSAEAGTQDPVGQSLQTARDACALHGLEFHLASDRAMHDDLWTNVTAHMWASRYGVGLFEDRVHRGLNHNLTIEIGGMLTTGRRCALLKDGSLEKMPTDLVGQIYKSVDLDQQASVADALHGWIRDDLGLPACAHCS